jgi:RNA:NAD 2'-phosphotransferase (TPT1/KptA family)
VLRVDAAAMHAGGITFYRSANGVWLVAHVPADYLVVHAGSTLDGGGAGRWDG